MAFADTKSKVLATLPNCSPLDDLQLTENIDAKIRHDLDTIGQIGDVNIPP